MDVLERLTKIRLFDTMSSEDREKLAGKFQRQSYSQGDVVIRQHDRATAFYIVDKGRLGAYVSDGDQDVLLDYFYPGDYFGESGLLRNEPRNATVKVLEDAELLVLFKQDFDQWMDDYPDIRRKLYTLSRQREAAGRMRFPWRDPEEGIRFFSKKHWIAPVREMRLVIPMGIVGLISSAVLLSPTGQALPGFSQIVLTLFSGVLVGLAIFFAGYNFMDWRNDFYVITNLRVLHVEKVLLLREDRDQAPIEQVQDVQVERKGMLANVLGFGDVIIQTAAATEKVVFADVADPDFVRDALFHIKGVHDRARDDVRESIRETLEKILVPSASDQPETPQEPAADTSEEEQPKASEDVLNLLRRVGRRLRDLVTFETRVVSPDGSTVTWRKNGWLLIGVSLPPFFAALFVTGIALFLSARKVGSLALIGFLLFLLLPISIWWIYVYWDWQNDIYQISGNRLIDLKKRPFFLQETRRETTLDRVQNISLSIPSITAQLLNYGTVIIETAGEMGAFEFEFVHNPRAVHEEVFTRLNEYRKAENRRKQEERRKEMAIWFEEYENIKRGRQAEGTFDQSDGG